MKRITRLAWPVVSTVLLFASSADAEVTIEAGTTIVSQQSSKQNDTINKDVTGSVDFVIGADIGPGKLHLYVEGSTTPTISASSVISGVNADAGTALNENGKGRVQLSGIAYGFDLNDFNVSVGVHDLTAFADATEVSNDEGSQFLADSLVNNPSIAFPDYTPSLTLNYGDADSIKATVLLGNAYGLGDNPSVSYADLFKFGRDGDSGLRKGLFGLVEASIPGDVDLTLGGWVRTSELPQHLGGANRSRVYGLYANLDGVLNEKTLWSIRAGWNSGKATDEVTSHLSLAVEHRYKEDHIISLGMAWNGLSSDYKATFANAANPIVAELYYRWEINEYISISPDIQYRGNSNNLSTTSAGMVGGSAWVYGLRVQIDSSPQMFHAD